MGKFVIKNAVVKVNGVDLSSHVSSVSVETTKDEVDVTGMSNSGWREFTDGFADAQATVTFWQDYAGGQVDATLYPLYTAGSVFPFTVQPEAAGTVLWRLDQARIFNYNPVSGGAGDASSFDATFRNSGTAGLTRGTA